MKAHIGVDADSGLVHTVIRTATNVNDVTQANGLLPGNEEEAFGDAWYQGVEKRPEASSNVHRNIAMRPGKRRALDTTREGDRLRDQLEAHKASVRAKVEHPFPVIKRQFGFAKVRYRSLIKNSAALMTMFALSNLWMVRPRLAAMTAEVRP